jgi:hypothetical protein
MGWIPMSMSPSRCHLGLRRIPAIPTNEKDTKKLRTRILTVQTHIINIPLHNGFSPLRWQLVINAVLEKIPGRPLLHKLRVIHILEADYNLILKVIFWEKTHAKLQTPRNPERSAGWIP